MAGVGTLQPLAMSQTKEVLLKHLDMSPETYNLMSKETDRIYKWLTSDKRHLKSNCRRKPPYDWSDIAEKSKDEAIRRISRAGTPHTRHYWEKAASTSDCENWIARWFLYHLFRFRDNRNQNSKAEPQAPQQTDSSAAQGYYYYDQYGGSESIASGSVGTTYQYYDQATSHYATSASTSAPYATYATGSGYNYSQNEDPRGNAPTYYYDPVRDASG